MIFDPCFVLGGSGPFEELPVQTQLVFREHYIPSFLMCPYLPYSEWYGGMDSLSVWCVPQQSAELRFLFHQQTCTPKTGAWP